MSMLSGCDSYLWVESGAVSYPLGLAQASVPTAGYLIDVHRHLPLSLLQAALFDVVFVAQRKYVDAISVINVNTHWLPLAAPAWLLEVPRGIQFDVGFVGSLAQSVQRRRVIEAIGSRFATNDLSRRYSIEEMARVYASSRIVVNPPVGGDINMRFFEAMACGAALMSPQLGNGVEELATRGLHYETSDFSSEESVLQAVQDLLRSGRDREIAARARALVRDRHTYGHRLETIRTLLSESAASAPVRSMTAREQSQHLLQLAEAVRDRRLLRGAVPGLSWTPSVGVSVMHIMAASARRAVRDHRGLGAI